MKKIVEQLMEQIKQSDLVLIGIGEELEDDFSGFQKEYCNILEQMEKNDWRAPFYKSKYLSEQKNNQYIDALKKLKTLIYDKNYFIITTCKDGYIHKAGFDEEKIVTPCGGYQFLQCGNKCDDKLVLAKDIVEQVICGERKHEKVCYPVCDSCGEALCFNNIYAEQYNEQGYMEQWKKYTKWLQGTINRKVCVIELGVGLMYPTVIRWPFEKVAMYNLKASFYRVHESLHQLPDEISEKGVSVKMNALEFLTKL